MMSRVRWDPVTGLGQPDMKHLQRAAIAYLKLQLRANEGPK